MVMAVAHQRVEAPLSDHAIVSGIVEVIDTDAGMRSADLEHSPGLQNAVQFRGHEQQSILPINDLGKVLHDMAHQDAIKVVRGKRIGRFQDVLNHIHAGKLDHIEVCPSREDNPAAAKIEFVHGPTVIRCDTKNKGIRPIQQNLPRK